MHTKESPSRPLLTKFGEILIPDAGKSNTMFGLLRLTKLKYDGICDAGPITNWDSVSFKTADSSKDSDCMIDPNFQYLEDRHVTDKTPMDWNWHHVSHSGIFGYQLGGH